MAFKFLGQRQLGKLPSRWVSTILMVAIRKATKKPPPRPHNKTEQQNNKQNIPAWLGGWPCWGAGSSGLAGGALWPAPSFRLA